MLLSVFTPVHPASLPYIDEAYKSLLAQDYARWEWVILANGGAEIPPHVARDPRVRLISHTGKGGNVGQLKRAACERCTGDVLVELDADDLLTPDALTCIAQAFADPTVMFAYSNDAEFADATWEPHVYSDYYGWQTRPFEYQGHALQEMVAWEPSPWMIRFIYFAPDHVRAWRRAAYYALGGHNPDLEVADDHDLCCRTYLTYGAAGIRHMDRCLYLYRVRADSTSHGARNDAIQEQTHRNYWTYAEGLALRKRTRSYFEGRMRERTAKTAH